MNLGLISCTKSKQTYQCSAGEMYQPSTLFSKAYAYALKNYSQIGILSAKYGLLMPEEMIDPYDLTLKTMGKQRKQEWANQVLDQLDTKIGLTKINTVYFHAGVDYRSFLIPLLNHKGIKYEIPLEGLSYGRQLQWYDRENQRSINSKRKENLFLVSNPPKTCKNCDNHTVLPCLYGLIEDKWIKENKNKYVLMGCIVSDYDPKWACKKCGAYYFEDKDKMEKYRLSMKMLR